jgi:hypothetical protein
MSDARQRLLSQYFDAKHRHGVDIDRLLSAEELQLLREARGLPASSGVTPGERFTASASLQAWREGMSSGVEVPVAEAQELPYLAATVAHPRGLTTSDVGGVAALPSTVLDLVTIIPVESGLRANPIGVSGTEVTGIGLIQGASSKEITLTSRKPETDMVRFSLHANGIPKDDIVRDDARARRLIDTILRRFWARQVAFEVLFGDGTTVGDRQQLTGIVNTAGIGTIAVATNDRVTALAQAIRTVQNGAGYDGSVQLVINPNDLEELVLQSTWRRDRYPDLSAIVASSTVTAGTSVVGSFAAADLFSTGVSVEISDDHSDNWIKGVVTLQPTGWLHLDVPTPSAFCRITGM